MIQFAYINIVLLILLALIFLPLYNSGIRFIARTKKIYLALMFVLILVLISLIYAHISCDRYVDTIRMDQEMTQSLAQGPSILFTKYSLNPLSAVLLYLVALTHNYALLPCIAGVIFWGCLFYCIWGSRDLASPGSLIFSLLFTLCFLNLAAVADNIRFPIASILFCTSVIDYFFINHKILRAILLDVIACLVHFSLWPLLVIFLVSIYCTKKICTIVGIASLGYFPLIGILSSAIASINPALGYKIQLYFIPDGQYYFSGNSIEQTLFNVLGLVYAITINCLWHRKNPSSKKYEQFFLMSLFLALGSFPSNGTFSRLAPLLIIFTMIPLAEFFSSYFLFSPPLSEDRVLYQKKDGSLHLIFIGVLSLSIFNLLMRSVFTYAPFHVTL